MTKKVAVKRVSQLKQIAEKVAELRTLYDQRGETIKQLVLERVTLADKLQQSEQLNANALAELRISLTELQRKAVNVTDQLDESRRQVSRLEEANTDLRGTISGYEAAMEALGRGLVA